MDKKCDCGVCHPSAGVTLRPGLMPNKGVLGTGEKAVVSSTGKVCKGEFVRKVLEYVPVAGQELRWALEDVHILDAVELNQERVGVVFAQKGQTKFKLLALENGALALGNTLVLLEDEALENAALVELSTDRAMVCYNREGDGMAAVLSLSGRTAALEYTDLWGDGDPENICACPLGTDRVLISGMLNVRGPSGNAGEVWVRAVTAGTEKLDVDVAVRVDGSNETDIYAGGWSLVRVAEDTAVLVYPQGLDKPVGFAVIDLMDGETPSVRLIGNGKYAASLPALQAVAVGEGRWAMVYGIGWLTPDRQVVKSTLALEVWGLTRYAAELIWYGCEDTRFDRSVGGVSAMPHGLGAAVTYTAGDAARIMHIGVTESLITGPGVVFGGHSGFCRAVPINLARTLIVAQNGGEGTVALWEVAERVIPSTTQLSGVAVTGGEPGEEISIKVPGRG